MAKCSKYDYMKPHSGDPTTKNNTTFSLWIRTIPKSTNRLLRWWLRPKR